MTQTLHKKPNYLRPICLHHRLPLTFMEEKTARDQLNREQKLAVTQIDGPVMVIAGPGTGKTQILASRVAHILNSTDSSAQNILCLTYTEAGTIAMRKRLLSLIGHDAHRVSIHTFHGFCNRVIQENQEHFDYKELDAVSDLEKIEYLSEIAIHLDDNHLLKKMKGNVGYLVESLSGLFDWMKKENVTAHDISKLIKQRKVDMLEGDEFRYKRAYKGFKKGDINPTKFEKAEKQLNDLEAACNLFGDYDTSMANHHRYDYADMILWVIKLFQTQPNVLADYQEKFHYLLVDEFQDTSGSQNDILNLLINYWEKPNVFVVGDDDQSIYRFQGAEVKNVMDFANTYGSHLKSIMLQTNYRSTQHILNSAKSVIDNNQDRLVNLLTKLDKDLKSSTGQEGEKTKVVSVDNPYLEAIWVVEDIKLKIKNGEKASNFAVIYANHAHADLIGELLHKEDIPVYLKRAQNVITSDTVSRITTILRFIVKENKFPFSADFELFELLHYPYFGISGLNLARLAYYINKNRTEFLSWRTTINEIDKIAVSDIKIPEDQIQKIKTTSQLIEEIVTYATLHSPQMVVRKIVESLQLTHFALDNNQFHFELESVVSFINFVESECNKNSTTTIDQILTKLDLMNKHRIPISKENIVYDKTGINLLTAHSSKGLEFKHVYVVRCIDKAWEKRKKHGTPFGIHKLFNSDDDLVAQEELRRLFYVAMTRAERSLTLTYYNEETNGKEVSRSMFIDEVLESNSSEYRHELVPQTNSTKKLARVFTESSDHTLDILDPPFLDDYLSSYKLSVSHLNSYLECPTRFYFQNILRVPSSKNVYMSFGIAVHNTLDQVVKILNEDQDKLTTNAMRDIYTFYLKKERSVFTDKEYEDFLTLGKAVLSEFISHKKSNWQTLDKIETEVVIDRVEVEGVPIKGQLDKIEFTGKTVNVVDYKTGDAKNGLKKLSAPTEGAGPDDTITKQFGGPYWRQIMFYSLLVNHDKTRDYAMVSGEMDFVEPSDSGEFLSQKVLINPENETQMKSIVQSVYHKIMDKQFSKGCMDPECYWCNFTKNLYPNK